MVSNRCAAHKLGKTNQMLQRDTEEFMYVDEEMLQFDKYLLIFTFGSCKYAVLINEKTTGTSQAGLSPFYEKKIYNIH